MLVGRHCAGPFAATSPNPSFMAVRMRAAYQPLRLPVVASRGRIFSRLCSSLSHGDQPFDIGRRAAELKVPISPAELKHVEQRANERGGGEIVTHADYLAMIRDSHVGAERSYLIEFIQKIEESSPVQHVIVGLDYLATGLFAALGVIIAGNTGMNVVGCTVVGCAASLGGGTVNNLLTNNTRGGVFWMRSPWFLATSLAVSIATFYLWPMHEDAGARAVLSRLQRAAGVDELSQFELSHSLTQAQFELALRADPRTAQRVLTDFVRHHYPHAGHGQHEHAGNCSSCMTDADATKRLYAWLALHGPDECGPDGCGPELDLSALRLLIRWETLDSEVLYAGETLALGAVAVIGAQGGIARGAPPIVCVALGVTICAGGVLRDVLCQRPVAIGGQSYALATAAGASVYVCLRQLVVAGYALPMPLRIALGAGTTIAQRAYVWYFASDHGVNDAALAPMDLRARSDVRPRPFYS